MTVPSTVIDGGPELAQSLVSQFLQEHDPARLEPRDFFAAQTPVYRQNQFGGTLGGPIVKNRTFFFTSYEGRRIRQGIVSPAVTVPTSLERPSPSNTANGTIVGDFSQIQGGTPFAGVLTNSALLTNRPGCQAATTASVETPASRPPWIGMKPMRWPSA